MSSKIKEIIKDINTSNSYKITEKKTKTKMIRIKMKKGGRKSEKKEKPKRFDQISVNFASIGFLAGVPFLVA